MLLPSLPIAGVPPDCCSRAGSGQVTLVVRQSRRRRRRRWARNRNVPQMALSVRCQQKMQSVASLGGGIWNRRRDGFIAKPSPLWA